VSVSLSKLKEFLLKILNMKKKKFPLKSWYSILKQAEFTQNPSDILIFKPKQMDSKKKKNVPGILLS
jgi:mRNA-degrading endonuclease HigB of HigAB toxin-antitoxin module